MKQKKVVHPEGLPFYPHTMLTDSYYFLQEKARRAMDALWSLRHRASDLVGMVLNVQSGDWIRRDSGVGAGIDSYYEYLFKAHILLGDEHFLERFNTVSWTLFVLFVTSQHFYLTEIRVW